MVYSIMKKPKIRLKTDTMKDVFQEAADNRSIDIIEQDKELCKKIDNMDISSKSYDYDVTIYAGKSAVGNLKYSMDKLIKERSLIFLLDSDDKESLMNSAIDYNNIETLDILIKATGLSPIGLDGLLNYAAMMDQVDAIRCIDNHYNNEDKKWMPVTSMLRTSVKNLNLNAFTYLINTYKDRIKIEDLKKLEKNIHELYAANLSNQKSSSAEMIHIIHTHINKKQQIIRDNSIKAFKQKKLNIKKSTKGKRIIGVKR